MSAITSVKVTEVARKMSLAPSTVSKALRGINGKVSTETTKRVLDYCEGHGYISASEARRVFRRMNGRSTGNKQIFALASRDGLDVYSAALASFYRRLQDNDLFASTYVIGDQKSLRRFPHTAAGVIAIAGQVSLGVVSELNEENIPVLTIDNLVCEDGVQASAVNSNNLASVTKAVQILAKKGHRDIAYLSVTAEPFPAYTFQQRKLGYISGMVSAGLPVHDDRIYSFAEGWVDNPNDVHIRVAELAKKLCDSDPMPTAVIACCDVYADIIRQVARSKGLSVPKDLSIIGYDGLHKLAVHQRNWEPLSTMVVDWDLMGQEAAELSLDMLSDSGRGQRYLDVPTVYEDCGTVASPRD